MTDVLRIALDRRDHLQTEIARLDEFIRTAEQLIRNSQPAARPAAESEQLGSAHMNLLRRGTAAGS